MNSTTRLQSLPTPATQKFLDALVAKFDVGARWIEAPSGDSWVEMVGPHLPTKFMVDAWLDDSLHRVALIAEAIHEGRYFDAKEIELRKM